MIITQNGRLVQANRLIPLDPNKLNPGLASLIAHYKGDGDYNDSSANARHLSKVGYVGFGPGVGGRQSIFFLSAGELTPTNAAHNAAFRLTGDFTFVCLFHPVGESAMYLASVDSPTDGASADNLLWNLARGAHVSATFQGGLYTRSEYATQAALEWYGDKISVPDRFSLLAVQREIVSGTLTMRAWVDGFPSFNPFPTSTSLPTGGGNSLFRLGSDGKSTNRAGGWMQDAMVFDTAIPYANILAECYRIGVR